MKEEAGIPARSRLDEIQNELDAAVEQNVRFVEINEQLKKEIADSHKQYSEVMQKLEEEANTRNNIVGLLNEREDELAKVYRRLEKLGQDYNTSDKYIDLLEKAYTAQSAAMQAMMDRKHAV